MASMTNLSEQLESMKTVPEELVRRAKNGIRLPHNYAKVLAKVCDILHRSKKISTKYFTRISSICDFDSILKLDGPAAPEFWNIKGTYHDIKFIRSVLDAKHKGNDQMLRLIDDYGFNTDTFEVLAIGIYLHGAMQVDEKGHAVKNKNYPDGIYMRKKTISAIGCVTFKTVLDLTAKTKAAQMYSSTEIALTTRTVYALEECGNKDVYLKTIKNYPPEKVGKLHKDENSFVLHEGKTDYYEKKFSRDRVGPIASSLIFMRESGVYIDLMSCSLEEFIHFFCQREDENVASLKIIFSNLIKKRETYITTTDLHLLIAWAQHYLPIKNVNILDISCNLMKSVTNDPTDQCVLSPGYSISCNGFIPDPSVGWGGKSRRKRRKRTRGKKRY